MLKLPRLSTLQTFICRGNQTLEVNGGLAMLCSDRFGVVLEPMS
jgi:hypothetical protein